MLLIFLKFLLVDWWINHFQYKYFVFLRDKYNKLYKLGCSKLSILLHFRANEIIFETKIWQCKFFTSLSKEQNLIVLYTKIFAYKLAPALPFSFKTTNSSSRIVLFKAPILPKFLLFFAIAFYLYTL
jgi:hypothetical protein